MQRKRKISIYSVILVVAILLAWFLFRFAWHSLGHGFDHAARTFSLSEVPGLLLAIVLVAVVILAARRLFRRNGEK